MAGAERMTIEEVVRRVLREEHGDVIRESVRLVAQELMEAEVVRHEALSDRAGCETSPSGCRGSPWALGASRSLELRVTAGAAPTTPGRAGTIGSCGLGKRDGAVQRMWVGEAVRGFSRTSWEPGRRWRALRAAGGAGCVAA